MRISVDTNNVKLIEKQQIESGEYNVTPCLFEFSEEYAGLVKTAVFTGKDKKAYKMIIQNNECTIPAEVLEKEGTVELGVFGYVIEDDDLELRYSPKPCIFAVSKGSYKEAENSTPPTPTQFEQYEQALNEGLAEVANVDIDASKVEHTATITITNRNGESKSVQVLDGEKGDKRRYRRYRTRRTRGKTTDHKETQDHNGPKGDPGAIKMLIVNELPQVGEDDTIYLVPNDDPETQNYYDEYVYVDGEWEKLGGVQVEVDLTDYVKNTDYSTTSKAGVIRRGSNLTVSSSNGTPSCNSRTYAEYQSDATTVFISKGTLENVITGKDLTTKAYVDGLVGNIATAIDTINR